jgi:hypothetical protein
MTMRCYGCRHRGRIGFDIGCRLINRITGSAVDCGCKITNEELDDLLEELGRERVMRGFRSNIKKGGTGNGKDPGDRG